MGRRMGAGATLTARSFNAVRRDIEAREGCRVLHGWHLCGSGAARYGWAAVYPSGLRRWLGRTRAEVVRAATFHLCGGPIRRSGPIDGTPDGAAITYCARCAAFAWQGPLPSGVDQGANLAAWNAHERRSPDT